VTAVAVSGFNALSFAFYGFLPRTAGDIRKVLRRVEKEYSPLSVFYESPNRIMDTVELVGEVLPDFRVCVCNDLTKKFERIYRGTPEEVLSQLKSNPNATKGEYVLLLERGKQDEKAEEEKLSPEALLVDRMVKAGISAKEAVALLAAEKVLPKRELYDGAVRLRELL
jgi:16S rRNA (cytidine1402-2'-O)-methyltransferase